MTERIPVAVFPVSLALGDFNLRFSFSPSFISYCPY
jgi:hypothetical protein